MTFPLAYLYLHYAIFLCMVIHMHRERTIIGSVSNRNRYWVYRIESYRLLLYRPILRASLQVHQLLMDRITHDDHRAFKRPVTRPPRAWGYGHWRSVGTKQTWSKSSNWSKDLSTTLSTSSARSRQTVISVVTPGN